jgi:hypothetical protein
MKVEFCNLVQVFLLVKICGYLIFS